MASTTDDTGTVAALIARLLQAHGIDRVFGLQGGHVQPIWDHAHRLGIKIYDVRHESAAVHMAQAHAELTGNFAVAMVTAGPGVTNTVTAIANAHIARIPVLVIGGCPPRPQVNMGPLQDIAHVDIMRPVTRQSRTLRVADQVLRELDEAIARAMGDLGEPGPVYIEIPTDVLRENVPPALALDEYFRPKPPRRIFPDPNAVAAAVNLLWQAKRPLVLTGRGAKGAGPEIVRLLDRTGAVYLDTQESRGLVPNTHPAVVAAARAQAMSEADLVLVVGRKLDYQVGYGSPAVFPKATFVRLADTAGELIDNRRGEVELLATPALALAAMVEAAGNREPATDRSWSGSLREKHVVRERKYAEGMRTAAAGKDGKMHPNRIFAALEPMLKDDCVRVADGGDLLSFARVAFANGTYLDAGAFGCLGIGVAYANAAALAFPGRQVVCVTGDGAFGINAMEIDTAARHGCKVVVVVANNAAWNIERYDQEVNYGGRVVGTTLAWSNYGEMAKGLGLHGERVEDPADLPAALERAFANAPALVDVVVSQHVVSSDANKGLGFVPDYQAVTPWNDAERVRRGLPPEH